ncbi:hypothetical protein GT030_15110 [Streptomyces sp. SID1328]|uniref:hypothetical protein n=1 Tax=Streptomyces sp. SID1328 TaxID=2690250 RepID=UPI00136F0A95|nr:hypothetical protein [Streptomyces sp. SID1328]MYV40160.1 hypothetical protein [Streptomyces sp. SID1328]
MGGDGESADGVGAVVCPPDDVGGDGAVVEADADVAGLVVAFPGVVAFSAVAAGVEVFAAACVLSGDQSGPCAGVEGAEDAAAEGVVGVVAVGLAGDGEVACLEQVAVGGLHVAAPAAVGVEDGRGEGEASAGGGGVGAAVSGCVVHVALDGFDAAAQALGDEFLVVGGEPTGVLEVQEVTDGGALLWQQVGVGHVHLTSGAGWGGQGVAGATDSSPAP